VLRDVGVERVDYTPGPERRGTRLGAFSFAKSTSDLRDEFSAGLCRHLGTDEHLVMMLRYGFTAEALRPALDADGTGDRLTRKLPER
jgi:hypothetical protein